MRVTEDILKSVGFIAIRNLDNNTFHMKGTAFFVVCDYRTPQFQYVVTAKHVIEQIDKMGIDELYVMVNLKNGQRGAVRTKTKDWIFNSRNSIDIAIHHGIVTSEYDQLYIPLSKILSDEIIKKYDIGIGEEVIITGLFVHHHGNNKNIPIIRVGNLVMFPEDKIQTKDYIMDAYLIEARSIGGLSGSPVFVNLGSLRVIDGELKKSDNRELYLIGIIHGHFHDRFLDLEDKSKDEYLKLNTGIAIVIPIYKLMEMFNQKEVLDFEKKVLES